MKRKLKNIQCIVKLKLWALEGPSGRVTYIISFLYLSYLVDPASSRMLVSKIKPCM